MDNKDIRWMQRFNNYKKALARLTSAIELSQERDLSDLEQQGLIQAFEFTFDMAWKTLQDFITEKTKSRNKTSHTYNEETADEVAGNIIEEYHGLLIQLETRLQVEKINQEKQG